MLILPLHKDDEELVWEFLRVAAHEEAQPAVRANPDLARYAQGWGREGDCGFRALYGSSTIGLIWARLFPAHDRGFGWLGNTIPELSIAVQPQFRGQGVGRRLLEELVAAARDQYGSLSLNVRSDNEAAVHLYESCGFRSVPHSEIVNRVGGTSFTMRLDL